MIGYDGIYIMQVNLSFALLLTTLAGLSTGIGSAIAFFIRKPKYSYLAVMLGFSAGVMVYISFVELLKTSVENVGFTTANLGFFAGMGFIALLDILIPMNMKRSGLREHASPLLEEFSDGFSDRVNQDKKRVGGSLHPLLPQVNPRDSCGLVF